MPTKSSQLESYRALVKAPKPDQQPPSTSATLLKRALPQSSVQKAKKAFAAFSLSKFPEGSLPSNYVHPYKNDASFTHAERAKHVQDVQRKKIEQHLHKLKTTEQDKGDGDTVTGITLALPKGRVATFLPSYKSEKGTVTLEEVMNLVTKYTRGTEFHAKGNPTLNRVAFLKRVEKLKENLGLQAHVQKKGESK